MAKRWVACISQTGSELYTICETMLRKPDALVITNKSKVIPGIWDLEIDNVYIFDKRPSTEQLLDVFKDADVITLHGYLYILPPDICKRFAGKIFNGHPGLITKYPELVGKDPQIRAWNKYPSYGCVLHEVTAAVDRGPIIDSQEIDAYLVKDLDDLFIVLKDMSISLWLRFFLEKFEEENLRENCYAHSSFGNRIYRKEHATQSTTEDQLLF